MEQPEEQDVDKTSADVDWEKLLKKWEEKEAAARLIVKLYSARGISRSFRINDRKLIELAATAIDKTKLVIHKHVHTFIICNMLIGFLNYSDYYPSLRNDIRRVQHLTYHTPVKIPARNRDDEFGEVYTFEYYVKRRNRRTYGYFQGGWDKFVKDHPQLHVGDKIELSWAEDRYLLLIGLPDALPDEDDMEQDNGEGQQGVEPPFISNTLCVAISYPFRMDDRKLIELAATAIDKTELVIHKHVHTFITWNMLRFSNSYLFLRNDIRRVQHFTYHTPVKIPARNRDDKFGEVYIFEYNIERRNRRTYGYFQGGWDKFVKDHPQLHVGDKIELTWALDRYLLLIGLPDAPPDEHKPVTVEVNTTTPKNPENMEQGAGKDRNNGEGQQGVKPPLSGQKSNQPHCVESMDPQVDFDDNHSEGGETWVLAATMAMEEVDVAMKGEVEAKKREGETAQNAAKIDAETKIISKQREGVSISPEVASKNYSREILNKLQRDRNYKSFFEGKIPAYDGKKSLYTAGPLPFTSKDFVVEMEKQRRGSSESEVQKFQVTIKLANEVDIHFLQEYLAGRSSVPPQDAIQVLDVVLRAAKPTDAVLIGRSFFSESLGKDSLGEGLEYWRGYYQSIRPTQMGLSLNIDASAPPLYEPIMVDEFVTKYLNLGEGDFSRPFSDANHIKVKRALKGIIVETNHLGFKKCYKVVGVSSEPADQLDNKTKSVAEYFKDKYNIQLRHPALPCIQIGSAKRHIYLPMEVCNIVHGQKYLKKLNESQVTSLLRATCQRPPERESEIIEMVKRNRYSENQMVEQFGMNITEVPVTVDARVLPPPKLKYHDSGAEREVAPGVGQWNMINKKMYIGATVSHWTCLSFSRLDRASVQQFCKKLVAMCSSMGMNFTPNPVLRICSAPPAQIEKALSEVGDYSAKEQTVQLLIIILPEVAGSYGKIKRICETELGIVSQCCQPKHAKKCSVTYLANVALKINVKAGGSNTVLCDAIQRNIPLLTDRPTIIFGADVTHAQPGEDSSASIAAVVASMDWPGVTKYRGLVRAQGHQEEIIKDLYACVRELLIAFMVANNKQKPERIIFFRDGVSEGQFAQVFLYEVDVIRQACESIEENYQPHVTFVIVQKRHHTRLFSVDNKMTDTSGNILPGTVVDSKICHPLESCRDTGNKPTHTLSCALRRELFYCRFTPAADLACVTRLLGAHAQYLLFLQLIMHTFWLFVLGIMLKV